MKRILIFVFLLSISTLTSFSQTFEKQGAGVTIIVHGWNPDASQPAWMQEMANAIITRNGGVGQLATITVTGTKGNLSTSLSNWTFDLANQTHAEIIVLVNWTAVANNLTTGVTTQEVAASVAPLIYNSQNGEIPLASLPIHLIGHSRGGGMIFEIARLLGLQGVEVEHVTALDPHPLTAADPQGVAPPFGPGQTIDAPISVYENILFADCYYQNIQYPTGQYVNGAYNRLWTSLPGGYHNETGYTYTIGTTTYDFSDHLNIILMYHGTIDLATPTTNGEATMNTTERAWFNTYENAGENTGFKYSRQIMGNRKSTDIPNSGDAVVDGFHNDALLNGAGTRTAIDRTNAVWPNILTVDATLNGNALSDASKTSVYPGDNIHLNTTYRTNQNSATINFYLDTDRNPYNGYTKMTNANVSATGNTISEQTVNFTVPTTLTVGEKYYLLTEITDATEQRFLYAPYEFVFDETKLLQITSQPQNQTNICIGSNVQFSLSGNNIDSYQWQGSPDNGVNFANLSDADVFSGATTDNLSISGVTLGMNDSQYRCIVSNSNETDTSDVAILTIDSENPQITSIHNNQTVDADANCQASLPDYTGNVTATDNCDANLNITQSPIAGTTILGATNTVTLTVSDTAGNFAEVSFNVDVVDNTNPTITCVGNQTVNADSTNTYTVQETQFDPTETNDNCEVASIINNFNNLASLANAQLPVGTTTIVWTVTDIAGNTNTCSFDVTVNSFVGIETLQQSGILIYPNPTNGIINFDFAKNNIQKLTISDMTGKEIIKKTKIQQNEQIDLLSLESGIYIISIQTDNEIFTTKIIKE